MADAMMIVYAIQKMIKDKVQTAGCYRELVDQYLFTKICPILILSFDIRRDAHQ
jgi:hypothetical protein